VSEPCPHPEVDDGACTRCGACIHEVILNRVCLRCGEVDPAVTIKVVPPALVPVSRLRRGKS
jgi:hypothetical protein